MGYKLRIPAGTLIGAMIFTAVLSVVSQAAYIPSGLKFYTQIATGAYIGAKISKSDVMSLREVVKPAIILMLVMLAFSIGVGLLIYRISELSIATALFSMAPAGVSDMALASMDFDAEPSVVAFMQTMRIIFILFFIPLMIKGINQKYPALNQSAERNATERAATKGSGGWRDLGLTLCAALICGGVGKAINVPGGAIAFSMAGCASVNIMTGHGYMPLKLRQFIQIFAGALIGCTVGREQLVQMKQLLWVVILGTVGFVLMDLVAAALIGKLTNMDITTALFACSPGGLTDMTLIAEDMGADSLKVAGMHTIRLVSVIAVYPSIINTLLPLLS